MNQHGTGYRTASRADYGGAASIDHDFQSTAGYGATGGTPVVSFVNVSKHYGSL